MDMVIRVVILYLAILIGLRVMGKREFAQMTPLELVSLLIVPEIVSEAIARSDHSVTGAVIGVATLFTLVFATSFLTHYIPSFERVVSSSPTVLVGHGSFLEDNMNKERVTPEEILVEMHKSGLYELKQVKWAVLETDGKISIVPEENALQRLSEQKMQDQQGFVG
jgi:uncharacterized membrane protein YcaP (DUF421 family)